MSMQSFADWWLYMEHWNEKKKTTPNKVYNIENVLTVKMETCQPLRINTLDMKIKIGSFIKYLPT